MMHKERAETFLLWSPPAPPTPLPSSQLERRLLSKCLLYALLINQRVRPAVVGEMLDLLHTTVVKAHRQQQQQQQAHGAGDGGADAFLVEQAQLVMMACALALTPQVCVCVCRGVICMCVCVCVCVCVDDGGRLGCRPTAEHGLGLCVRRSVFVC